MPTPPTGQDLYNLAAQKIRQAYDHTPVPKDNPHWAGPWDCAELVSWAAYQLTGKLYGCVNNRAKPAVADAYSGAWANDLKSGLLQKATLAHALQVPGTVLIRKPLPGTMGHIAIADGMGETVEAAGKNLGVRKGLVHGRPWDGFALIPTLVYTTPTSAGNSASQHRAPDWLTLKTQNLRGPVVLKLQKALLKQGLNPGVLDGIYGPHTHAAVLAFQRQKGLIVDGWVGPETVLALGLSWPQLATTGATR